MSSAPHRDSRISRVGYAPVLSLLVLILLATAPLGQAGPWIMPGDAWLKADVQLLADAGVITSPISSWPLSWGDIAQDINRVYDDSSLSPGELAALSRLRRIAATELTVGEPMVDFGARVSEKPQRIRGFPDTPRGDQELWGSIEWTGDRFSGRVRASYILDDQIDANEGRLDGSYAVVAAGNWIIGASLIDRWWGPGWNGSLILSSNARPIPSLVIERNFSKAFETRWLSWLGPWSTSVIWGELETNRAVADARFFGWRVNFKPTQNLEVGLLRTAQWCGSGRQCDLDAFAKVLVGDSNIEEGGSVDVANQLAGVDFRWAHPIGNWPYAIYGQFIGEDEAGGFPSRFLGQLGAEIWGFNGSRGLSWRGYLEYSDTTCQFYENSRAYNCAYNNTFYPTGYRYRGNSIGHATDNDAQSIVAGFVVNDVSLGEWTFSLRHMRLNRGGVPDLANSLTSTPLDVTDVDIGHRRQYEFFDLQFGLGAEKAEQIGGGSSSDLRAFVGLTFRL